jgi:hypothetical protein
LYTIKQFSGWRLNLLLKAILMIAISHISKNQSSFIPLLRGGIALSGFYSIVFFEGKLLWL